MLDRVPSSPVSSSPEPSAVSSPELTEALLSPVVPSAEIVPGSFSSSHPEACAALEDKIPAWVEKIALQLKPSFSLSKRHGSRPPGSEGLIKARGEAVPVLEITLAKSPPVGAVPAFQALVSELFGVWFEREVKVGKRLNGTPHFVLPSPRQPTLEDKIEQSLPMGVELIRLYRYQVGLNGGRIDFVVPKVFVPPEKEEALREWRQKFELETGLPVFFKREWVAGSVVRQLQRHARGRTLFDSRDVPYVARILDQFHGQTPRKGRDRFPHKLGAATPRSLTTVPFLTIDPRHTQDMEDAISLRRKRNGNLLLYVAIIDVTRHVAPGGKRDRVAQRAGLAVYGRTRMIHPLGSKLANKELSFIPGKPRLSLVGCFEFSAAGALLRKDFFQAFVKSHARLSPEDADALLQSGSESELAGQLASLSEVTAALRSARMKSIGIIRTRGPGAANAIVEESMVLFKREFSEYLVGRGGKLLFRVLQPPNERTKQEVLADIRLRGIEVEDGALDDNRRIIALFRKLEETREVHLLNRMLDRFFTRSMIDTVNRGHFRLAPVYAEYKGRDSSGITNQLQAVSILNSQPCPFDDEELKRRMRLRNRKGHAFHDNSFKLRFLEALLAKLPLTGEVFPAKVLDEVDESSGKHLIKVKGFGRPALLDYEGDEPLTPQSEITVTLRGFNLPERSFHFEYHKMTA